MFKVTNEDTRTLCEIYSKLTIKTPERRQLSLSGVFIVNFGVSKIFIDQVDTFCAKSCIGNFSNILFKTKFFDLFYKNLF